MYYHTLRETPFTFESCLQIPLVDVRMRNIARDTMDQCCQ